MAMKTGQKSAAQKNAAAAALGRKGAAARWRGVSKADRSAAARRASEARWAAHRRAKRAAEKRRREKRGSLAAGGNER